MVKEEWEMNGVTFPEASDSLVPGYGAIGVHGAFVSSPSIVQPHLGLETHLHHICGLGKRHRHGPRRTARHETRHDPGIWTER